MYECFACSSLCTNCVSGAGEDQKRASDTLEMELQMAELPCRCLELSLGSSQEEKVLLTTGPFLQAPNFIILTKICLALEMTPACFT